MQKLVKNGKVAVLVSYGFGAGWSTWGEDESCMDGEMAQAILDENVPLAVQIAEKNWPDAYTGGIEDCQVEWIDEGAKFRITEYDGSESLHTESQTSFHTA